MSLQTLHSRIQVKSLTSNIISISAQGKTAAQAEDTANAVANSYVAYVSAAQSAAGRCRRMCWSLRRAPRGTSLPTRLLVTGGLGALLAC